MNHSITQYTASPDVSIVSKSGTARRFGASPAHSKPVGNRLIKEEVMEVYAYSLDKHFIEMIMGGEDLNTEELKQLLREFILQPKFAHGEIIKEGEPYFRCLDCEILKGTNQRTYICRTCFEKKSHKGHRFLLFNDATGNETCDCGNEGLLDHRWFCPDHGTCTKDDYQRVISVTPPTYLKNFNKVLKQLIYEIAFTCEAYRRGMQTNTKVFIDKVMEAMLAAIKYCVNLNSIFVVLIAEIITHAFKHPKNFKRRFYLIEGRYVKHNIHIIEDNTKMTYLENLIRYSSLFREDIQKQLREILLKLACAEEFKKKLVVDFHKVAHHLFSVRPNMNFYFSNITYLTIQIYASEENCLRVIKECSFDKLIDVLKQYARNYELRLDPEGEVLTRCLHPFELILEKENSGVKLIEKEGVVGQFLSVITEFQKTHSYDIQSLPGQLKVTSHVDNILGYWDFEEQIFTIVEGIAKNAGRILDKIGWDQDPGLFLIDWGEHANLDKEQNGDVRQIHLNIPLQRAMVAYLQNTLDRVDKDMVMKQLEYIRRSCPEAIEHLVGQAVTTIGAMRQCMIKLHGRNIEANPVTHRYFIEDGIGGSSFFDYDFTFVQMFTLLLNEESHDVFQLLYKSFFAHDMELIQIFEEANFDQATEQQIQIIDDFFNFLVQLMHGEVSFFNIFYKNPYFTGHSSKKTLDQIHRKILMTFLHKTYNFSPITDLKHDFRYMLRKDIFHEKILKDIADIDKESKTFKLKRPYRDLFDSFYLYPDRIINDRIIHNVRTCNKRPEIAEVGHFAQNLPYLDIIQQRIYEGPIIGWFSKFLEKFTQKYTCLIPAIVRLIILPLKLLERAKQLKLSRKFMEKSVFGFFGTKNFLEQLKKAFNLIEDMSIKNSLAKLINIFIPRSNIGNSMTSFIAPEDDPSMFDGLASMDPSELHKALEAQNSLAVVPTLEEFDETDLVCGLCRGPVDLNSEDVGIPTYISRSNVNYWELKGRKFRRPLQNADKSTIKLILMMIKRYYPYAEGLNAHDIDFADSYVAPRLKLDFYPALASCMHYMHRSCFSKAYTLLPGSAQEFECPLCKKLNNTFIGMEKVDAASRNILEEQIKKNKKFLGFLRKQGVFISMLPDPMLRFDFYNNFMHALFPKNATLELKENDPAADRKILKFTNLMRTSYFQLVRNSMIYDFESFMNRSYMCYKFAFVNLQSFVMKNYQFHQFFENFNKELAPTIFHILNHSSLMTGDEPPTMKKLYDVYEEALCLNQEHEVIKKKENTEKKKKKGPFLKPIQHHDHSRRLPKLPTDSKGKPFQNFKMNRRNKQIMMAYDYNQSLMRMNELVFESQEMLVQSMLHHTTMRDSVERASHDMTGILDEHFEMGRSRGSTPDQHEDYKEEELFDTLQKLMLLLESETEEDYLLAFWEIFLRFLLSNRLKDARTNIDLEMLPIDFLYLRSLGIFTRMLMSEGLISKSRHHLPDFDEMCNHISKNAELRNELVNELLSLTQRIIVSCILVFDFDKCVEVKNGLQFISDLRGDKEMMLNKLLGFLRKDLTINTLLSKDIWEYKVEYKNFFYVWRENMIDFLKKTRNPFELFVKNTTEIKPLIVELPSNFNEFNSEYLPKKCDICKEFCKACKTVVCLLCGKVMCKDKCLNFHEKKSKKDKKDKKRKKKKRTQKKKVNNFGSLDSDSDSGTDASSVDFDRELPDNTIMTPVKPRLLSPKGGHRRGRNSLASLASVGSLGSTAGTKKARLRSKPEIIKEPAIQESHIDIVTFNEEPSIEIGMVKAGRLSPIFSEDFETPIRPSKPVIDYADTKITDGILSGEKKPSIRARRLKKPQESDKENRGDTKNMNSRHTLSSTSSLDSKTPRPPRRPTLDRLTIGTANSVDSITIDTSANDTLKTERKKRRKRRRIRRGNMHKHADECHKGYTVYIGVQDQNVILFSIPREVKYNEKLYPDRFGQTLKDKVNMFEEDWNFFELNPFLLKKLREAVENHSLPQLVYALIKGDIKIGK